MPVWSPANRLEPDYVPSLERRDAQKGGWGTMGLIYVYEQTGNLDG